MQNLPNLSELRDPQTYAVIGAAMEVHNQLGKGFLEPVYQEALSIEFAIRSIPFQREVDLPVEYKGQILHCHYRADFVCYSDILVEIKALNRLGNNEEAQVLNYLKATGFERALLINFGASRLEHKRYARSLEKFMAVIEKEKEINPQMNEIKRR